MAIPIPRRKKTEVCADFGKIRIERHELEGEPRAIAFTTFANDDGTNVSLASTATDVWASMGQESESDARTKAFSRFQVDDALMAVSDRSSIFLHCLPAHRGEEVSASVIDGPRSKVWDEAENRLHSQKALLEYLIAG